MKCRHFLAKLDDPEFEWEIADPPRKDCPYQEKGKGAFMGEPKCAFTIGGKFLTDNWSCTKMAELRELVHRVGASSFSDDDTTDIVPHRFRPKFLILSYYKQRGRVNKLFVLEDYKIRIATEKDVDDLMDSWKLPNWQAYTKVWGE